LGVEACGNSQWFLDLVQRLGHTVWVGDAAQIRASYVRKQKTDKRAAAPILRLLLEDRFPKLWMPSPEERDGRKLLIHRHKLGEIRTRIKNGLQRLCLNQGEQKQRRVSTRAAGQQALQELPLTGWAGVRRTDLLALLEQLDEQVGKLDETAKKASLRHPGARLLETHPGVGPITALACVLTISDVKPLCRQ
jgi:transposase